MLKRYSVKFWIVFWLIAAVLLASWYVFLQVKNRNIANLKPITDVLPIGSEKRSEIQTLMDILTEAGGPDSEKIFLVLFQNEMELRPGGGFIGAFGVLKMKDGKIADLHVYDTGVFDSNMPETQTPPAPLAQILGRTSWKMHDSNWSPDFKTNAEKAEEFYKLGGGTESIDGVMAINSSVLNSILAITGPVKIDGYPGEYRDENAILQLEYQVEKGYAEQGIVKGERKNIMGELADILAQKALSFNLSEQFKLAEAMESHLKQKDIQFFFKDESLQKEIENVGWAGQIKDSENDYLMAIDANLNSLKSDYCIKRKMDYAVDLAGETPQAALNITYEHTCRAKDWMTTDYRDWLRVYAPNGSFLEEATGQNGDVQYSDEFGKKVFGMLVYVPVGESKTISLKYSLPSAAKSDKYNLLLQKQSGSGELPFEITVKKTDGETVSASETLTGDKIFGF